MKWLSIAILVIAVFAFSPVKSEAYSNFSFSVGFHNELSPYGTWVNYSNYGQCWRPYGYSGYRPYVDGSWSYSNYGPTWNGNEAWAPYTYNYGQWIYTASYGWIWIPGYDYHQNYVDWSYGGGYIGWRPQFPSGYYYPGNDSSLWIVINANNFGYRSYRPYALRSDYVRNLWDRRVFRQRFDRIDRRQLESVVRRPIRTVSLRERDIQIGNRRTRMFVTPDQEVRIQRHVEQVRRTETGRRFDNNDVRSLNERDNVMKRKFDDIRSREKSSKDFNRNENRSKDLRQEQINRSKDFQKQQENRNRKEFDTRKFEKSSRDYRKPDYRKSYSKPKQKEERRKPEPPSRSNFSRFDESRHTSVRSLENHSRKMSQPDRASYSFRKSDNHKSDFSRQMRTSDHRNTNFSRQMTRPEHSRKEVRNTRNDTQKRHKPPKN